MHRDDGYNLYNTIKIRVTFFQPVFKAQRTKYRIFIRILLTKSWRYGHQFEICYGGSVDVRVAKGGTVVIEGTICWISLEFVWLGLFEYSISHS